MYELSNKQSPSMAYFIIKSKDFGTVLISSKKITFNAAGIDLRIRNTVLYGLCNSNAI